MAKSDDKKLKVFLDTGSSINLLSKKKYDTMFSHLKINSSNIPRLTGIIKGHQINALGTVIVPISFGNNNFSINTIVADNITYSGNILIGLQSMVEMKVHIFTDEAGVQINNQFFPFIKLYSENVLSVNGYRNKKEMKVHDKRISRSGIFNNSECNNVQNSSLPKSILKKKKAISNIIHVDKDDDFSAYLPDIPSKQKCMIINFEDIISNEGVFLFNMKHSIQNMHENGYEIIFVCTPYVYQKHAEFRLHSLSYLDVNFQFWLFAEDFISYKIDILERINRVNKFKLSRTKSVFIGDCYEYATSMGIDYMSPKKFFVSGNKKIEFVSETFRCSSELKAESNSTSQNGTHCIHSNQNKVSVSDKSVSQSSRQTFKSFDNQNTIESYFPSYVLCNKNVIIPSNTSLWISVRLPNTISKVEYIMIFPEFCELIGVVFEPGIYKIENGCTMININNIRATDLEIKVGTKLTKCDAIENIHSNCNQIEEHCFTVADDNETRSQKFDLEFGKTDFPEHEKQLKDLLHDFEDTVALTGDALGLTSMISHKIDIPVDSKPIYIPPYRVPHSQKEIIEKEVSELQERNIIEQSNTPWSFPLINIKKPDGSNRICVDFRRLNALTQTDPYPMPSLNELLNSIGKSKYFSTIDLLMGFLQVPLDEASKKFTGFSTSQGHYCFSRMPFGLKSSPVTFVRLMDNVLKGLIGKICYIYIDDIIIIGNSITEHLNNIRLVLDRLRNANLKLKLKKCNFLKSKICFLGHQITEQGIEVNEDKVKAILDFKKPSTVKEIRSFLGLAGFYRKFVYRFATIAAPLTELLKKDVKFEWGEIQDRAFNTLKQALTNPPILALPDFSLDFHLVTDASGSGLGSVLMQKHKNKLRVVAYHSRKMSDAERNYTITEQETLAIIDALKHFRLIIFGYKIHVYTDHIAIKDLFKYPNRSGRRARWFLNIMDYDISFHYIPGRLNAVADCLSRYNFCNLINENDNDSTGIETCHIVNKEGFSCIDETVIRVAQDNDEEIRNIKRILKEDRVVPKMLHKYDLTDFILVDEILVKKGNTFQFVLPNSLINKVLFITHNLRGHPGRDETIRQTQIKYFFKNITSKVKKYIYDCHECALVRGKPSTQPISCYPVPDAPFERVVIDLLKLSTSVAGNNYILVYTDYLTRYSELVPQRTKTAVETAQNILKLIYRYGAPDTLMMDNGKEFDNVLLTELTKFYLIQKINILPYRLQANGVAERINKKILDVLKYTLSGNHEQWDANLDSVAYILNTRIHDTLKMSPFEALFGFQPRLHYEVNNRRFRSNVQNNPLEARINNARIIHNKVKLALEDTNTKLLEKQVCHERNRFKIGDIIYEKKNVLSKHHKTEPNFTGPYEIVEERIANKYIIRNSDTGEVKLSHADRFKLFKGSTIGNQQVSDSNGEATNDTIRKSERLANKLPVKYFEDDI